MELVDRDLLIRFMQAQDVSVRSLAAKTKVWCAPSGGRKPLSRATIGHLRSGHTRTCTVETAAAIEKALGLPPHVLFRPRFLSRQVSSAA